MLSLEPNAKFGVTRNVIIDSSSAIYSTLENGPFGAASDGVPAARPFSAQLPVWVVRIGSACYS